VTPRWQPDLRIGGGRRIVHNIHVHWVFATSHRPGVFDTEISTGANESWPRCDSDFQATLVEFNGEEDHVYQLVQYTPEGGAPSPRKLPQGVSSRQLRQDLADGINRDATRGRFWSPSYFARSGGGAPRSTVKDHITNQKRPDKARFSPCPEGQGFHPTSPMTAAITATQLSKSFGPTKALDGLDLSVETGEVHGFLGPNGAGKSTTFRVLLGLLRPDGGEATLLGGDPWRDVASLHRRLAYVPGDVNLWPNLSGGEVIDLLGRLRGGLDEGRRKMLLERFDLDPRKKGRAYSKGNRQKVALVAALASDVELLILDEPTAGLDPLMESVFRECIQEEGPRGRTVLLSSHILSEVEHLCDRVTIIKDGRVVETGTLAELRHLTRTHIEAVLAGPVPADLASLTGMHDLVIDGTSVTCDVDTGQLGILLERLTAVGVSTLLSAPPTLEELFLRHYGAQTPPAERLS
jgi:ABC-2 type transport system ATP-binding protein